MLFDLTMKKQVFIALFSILFATIAQAQVTLNPRVEGRTSEDVTITKVELTSQYTIISLRYEDPVPSIKDRYLRRMNPSMTASNIAIDPESDLQVNSKGKLYSFKFIKAEGIPVRPAKRDVRPGDVVSFVVYFERLDPGLEDFNLFECRDGMDNWHCWNFYHIHIKNPALKKNAKKTPAPVVAKKEAGSTIPPLTVLISGQVYDATTKEVIDGRIVLQKPGAKNDTLKTISSTGVYRKNVKPATYQVTVIAPGYEPATATVTVKENAVEKDFYLRATGAKPAAAEVTPPPVEPTPKEAPAEELKAEVGAKVELKNILFETGKADLLPESIEGLTQVVEWLKANPTVEIRLEGHTDAIGDSKANMKLSIDRVTTVKQYLVNNGIEASRIETQGFGDTKPLVNSTNDQQRRQNRRVELIVTKK
ncbi:hypothetical protein BWI96_08270 [Siphonobacter sp. SORGH_AS_0500]|nr:hypothetical protein BWI96_08270 [Siphonobacter sp. SORGH_AS_0500]